MKRNLLIHEVNIKNLFLRFGLLTLLLFLFTSLGYSQTMRVGGKITDENGDGLPGATILVDGTTTGTVSDLDGNYSIDAAKGAILAFSYTGFSAQRIEVGDSPVINVSLSPDDALLSEVVVTGYQIQRKRDITGAVSVVETDDMKSYASASFAQKLEGRAPGVTTSTSGAPGDATNVRIRGISTFGNNDPLYIIDGVPVVDKYNTGLNPNDIESMQVLKDASAASIYGARANNGVIVITTKKGKSGKTRVSYDGYYGSQTPVGSFSDILIIDSKEYVDMVNQAFTNGGLAVPDYATDPLPEYIYPVGNNVDPATYDATNNPIMLTNQAGTDWWDEITRSSPITDHTLNISGGDQNSNFSISGGYFKQEGTLIHTDFERLSLRANSEFKAGKNFRFGENLSFARSNGVSANIPGNGTQSEQGIITQVIKISPLVPVYDIMGNWGGSKAPSLGNGDNPVAFLANNKDNRGIYYRLLGNVFGEVDIFKGFTFRTSMGISYSDNFQPRFSFPTPENNEPNLSNGFNESWQKYFSWTWTNTIKYHASFSENSELEVLAGYEAIEDDFRQINGGLSNYFTTDINAWYLQTTFGDAASRNINSSGSEATLVSMFGKIDYAWKDKYLISATIRRDGSSRFSENNRYGVFPALSVGWRLSEDLLDNVDWISDLKVRAGWGITGNQNFNNYNFVDQYGSTRVGETGYDINGTNNSAATGYALFRRGNEDTKWEENESLNLGFDATLFNDKLTIVFDWFDRDTRDLLYQPPLPGTAGSAQAPTLNVGAMNNSGYDLGLGYRGNFSETFGYNVGLNLSHYVNEVVSVDGESDFFYASGIDNRLNFPININMVGHPISSFNGYVADGLFASQAEVDASGQTGAVVGGIKFQDLNGDGLIGDDDITIIGDPHPSLTMGLNLGVNIGGFDVTLFLFGSFGNDIFNYNKLFTDFRQFNANTSRERWQNAGTGSTPILSMSDQSSRNPSSYYVEDGSYLRGKTVQVGYTLPKTTLANWGMENLRFYIQGQNLFTFTSYSGLDPALSNANIGQQNDLNDLWTGYDFGNYPSSRVISFGVSANF